MRRLALPIVVAVLALSGCSSATSQESGNDASADAAAGQVESSTDTGSDPQAPGDGDAASSIPDPCEIFSESDISGIVNAAGFSASEVVSTRESDQESRTCGWTIDSFTVLSVLIVDLGQNAYDVATSGVTSGLDPIDIPGTDGAWQTTDGSSVEIASGTYMSLVSMTSVGDPTGDFANVTSTIATQVAANL
jgi:hypothetical protein